jgi:hypothetical protein
MNRDEGNVLMWPSWRVAVGSVPGGDLRRDRLVLLVRTMPRGTVVRGMSETHEPVCPFCGWNAWQVRHVTDVDGDHIYLQCTRI